MKFSVLQSSLLNAISIVMKGVIINTTLPIISGIYFCLEEETLELQTTDLNVSIKHKIKANVDEPGKTIIPAKTIFNIIKSLPDEVVKFEGGESQINISCGRSFFSLNTLNAADFPEFPTINFDKSIELPKNVLSDMVNHVYKVTSKDTSRPILSSILMTVKNNIICFAATDSYRLAVCDTNIETSSLDGNFKMNIPGLIFHNVLSIPSSEENILIGSTKNQIIFILGNIVYIVRKIEGNFPDYKRLLPDTYVTRVKINVGKFIGALKRMSVITQMNPSMKFTIDIENFKMTLFAENSELGEVREEIDIEGEGEIFSSEILFNYNYVFDCVSILNDTDEISFELQSKTQPGVFKLYSKINYLYLLMPVRS